MTKKKKSNLSLWLMLAGIVLLTAVLFLLPSCGGGANAEGTLVKTGEQAPGFTVEMVDGSTVTLQQLRGRVVLLNFWATWCPPCRAELKRVQTDLLDRFAGRDFTFLPLSRGEDRAAVVNFLDQNGYTFPAGLDPEKQIFDLYATDYIPRNFLIDKSGRIVDITVGYAPEEFDELLLDIETELQK